MLNAMEETCDVKFHISEKLIRLITRDAVFILNESGALSMRARRESARGSNYSVAEIAYDHRAHSDSVRLPKNARVLGMAANPTTECNFAIVTTDGRVILVDVLGDAANDQISSPLKTLESYLLPKTPSTSLRMLTTGILSGLPLPPFVVRMCPALTMKNMAEYRPLMAVGATCGNIQGSLTGYYT